MTLAVFLLALGATARTTRFVNDDVLFAPVRDRVDARFGDASRPAEFLVCAWCASVWAAAGVFLGAWASDGADWFTYPAAALTASWVYAIASSWLERES